MKVDSNGHLGHVIRLFFVGGAKRRGEAAFFEPDSSPLVTNKGMLFVRGAPRALWPREQCGRKRKLGESTLIVLETLFIR